MAPIRAVPKAVGPLESGGPLTSDVSQLHLGRQHRGVASWGLMTPQGLPFWN